MVASDCEATPRQDISCRVRDLVLESFNSHFCEAWDDATGDSLTAQRKDLKKQLAVQQPANDR